MSEYSSKLRDPRWQRKRLQIFEAAGWKCEDCGEETKELQAHHLIYKKGHSPWEYEEGEIMALCKDCHEKVSKLNVLIAQAVMSNRMTLSVSETLLEVLGFIHGSHGPARSKDEYYQQGYLAAAILSKIALVDCDITNDVESHGAVI